MAKCGRPNKKDIAKKLRAQERYQKNKQKEKIKIKLDLI